MSKPLQVDKILVSGSFWTGVGEVFVALATLATTIVSARVLAPRDFGLMGTAMLALGVVEHMSQTGFDAALVAKQEKVEAYVDVAWTWHVIRGLLITAIVCGSAPLLSRFYDEPLLWPIITVCSCTALIGGFCNPGQVFFTRELRFRTIFLIRAAHTVLRLAVVIPVVLILRNVWALVVGHVATSLLGLIITYVTHPYRPRFKWDWPRLKELFAYGRWITAFAVIGWIIVKGDDVFVSKYLGLAALGIYQLAYDVANMPTTNITHVLGRIGLPTYARLLVDREALRPSFVKVMRVTLLLSGPATVIIWIAIPDIVAHVIGPQWERAVPLVRILVISGFIRSFAALAGPIFQASGRPDLDFKMNVPRFICLAGLVWPFAAWWNLEGVSLVVVIAISTTLPTWFWGIHMLTGLRVWEVLKPNALAVVATAVLAGAYWGVRSQLGPGPLEAVGGALGGLAAALGLLWIVGRLTPVDFFGEIRRLVTVLRSP